MSKKNNEFSIEEYTSIRAELIERIKIMNSQEASALVGDRFKFCVNVKN